MKILLVDDEKFVLEGLKNMLDWKAFDGELIGAAKNGLEALEIIKHEKPDIIISDIRMPTMDGLELAKSVHNSSKNITFILLSGHGEFHYAQQGIQYGVKEYLLKPITREKLLELESILVNLNQSIKKKKASFLQTWDGTLKENILHAFVQGNREFFDSFFHSRNFIDSMELETSNTAGMQLIHYAYVYLSSINMNQTLLDSSLKKDIMNFYDLPNKEEKMNYVITKYYDLLMLRSPQKLSNSNSITSIAKNYVEENFNLPDFNISFLADHLNVTLSYLSTIFKQTEGINLSTYIIEKRIERAKSLLMDLTYSISEVSSLSGYEDAKYFAKLFKKKMNMTPSEYRNLYIYNQNEQI